MRRSVRFECSQSHTLNFRHGPHMLTSLSQPFMHWHEPWIAAVSLRQPYNEFCHAGSDYFVKVKRNQSVTIFSLTGIGLAWHDELDTSPAACRDPSTAWHRLCGDIHEGLNQAQPGSGLWGTAIRLCSLHQHGHPFKWLPCQPCGKAILECWIGRLNDWNHYWLLLVY